VLDRHRRAARLRDVDCEPPRAALIGRIELHDQVWTRVGDDPAPPLEPRDDLARKVHGRFERAAVETSEICLDDVARAAHVWRRRRHFDATRAVAADSVDHAGERRAGERPRVDAAVEHAHAPRHAFRGTGETLRVDERGHPAHRERTCGAVGRPSRTGAPPKLRHHRAARDELDCPDRDTAEPAHALGDVVAEVLGPGGDEPAQHVSYRNRARVRVPSVRQCNSRVLRPTRLGRAGGGEERANLSRVPGRCARSTGPRNDPPRFP
jgi:hypothetical protein